MKSNRKSKLLIASLMACLALNVGCYYDQVAPEVVELPDEPVSYTLEIQPFFEAKCISCHGGISPNLEAPDSYDNLINGGYINIDDPESSELYLAITVNSTMKDIPTDTEKAMTLKWIEEGANND